MSNLATLKLIEKGDGRGGRKSGATNLMTRALKKAIINAAEKSDHCPEDNKSLEGYCIFLANEHPPVFANMLTRLIPVQAKVKAGNMRVDELNINMSLSDMMSSFEMKIKSDYQPTPAVIEQPDVEVEQDEDDA